ncbi:MAG: hypothetical protein KGI29_05715 [Pseudomonadota bacterium]|nr:hypothetical protein [Pseudomonadota bacterium]MDE3038356.1 hypothetical protein [Pseudomonadota bacterium]
MDEEKKYNEAAQALIVDIEKAAEMSWSELRWSTDPECDRQTRIDADC